jgi:hypothetical protein
MLAMAGPIPLLAERGPPIRTGLWVLEPLPDNGHELSAFAAGVRANPELAGACIHIHWKDRRKGIWQTGFWRDREPCPCSEA